VEGFYFVWSDPDWYVAESRMSLLQLHPFAVNAHLEQVLAVSFAFPAEILRPMVSQGLELDEYGGHGFVTVALVWTKAMRPACFPECLGRDFFLAGYRIFTRLRDESGRRLRGLQVLRSETDKRGMVFTGNLLTGYGYRHVKVEITRDESITRVRSSLPGGRPTLDLAIDTSPDAPIPGGSPFPDWRTARRFAGPMPFTFTGKGDGTFVVVEGARESWTPVAVRVMDWEVGLFHEGPLAGVVPVLANAFKVENVGYRWEKGRIVRTGAHP
jgi:hypothetical protein